MEKLFSQKTKSLKFEWQLSEAEDTQPQTCIDFWPKKKTADRINDSKTMAKEIKAIRK